jgi:hypothetical protein
MSNVPESLSTVQFDAQLTTEAPARQAFRQAVATVADRARATLPAACASRIAKACALVLAHDVELTADGHARVFSQANGVRSYELANGTCTCKDFPTAPGQWCKHVRFVHPKLARNS